MTNEIRVCDRCGTKLHKDCGVWIGGVVELHGVSPMLGGFDEKKDLCYMCVEVIREFIGKTCGEVRE